jgi:hypothetical protein
MAIRLRKPQEMRKCRRSVAVFEARRSGERAIRFSPIPIANAGLERRVDETSRCKALSPCKGRRKGVNTLGYGWRDLHSASVMS